MRCAVREMTKTMKGTSSMAT
uniref:Uncharacterized protein n=1 Tax=Anguilla anguilla TaxID=7936 RepID=A0A0E9RQ77_ANGAN